MNIVICDDERYFVDLLELRLRKYAAGKDIGRCLPGLWH